MAFIWFTLQSYDVRRQHLFLFVRSCALWGNIFPSWVRRLRLNGAIFCARRAGWSALGFAACRSALPLSQSEATERTTGTQECSMFNVQCSMLNVQCSMFNSCLPSSFTPLSIYAPPPLLTERWGYSKRGLRRDGDDNDTSVAIHRGPCQR